MSLLFFALGLALLAVAAGWGLLRVGPCREIKAFRYLLVLVAVLLTSVPLSILLTLVLIPFWRWLEATQGIESIGHSGPAEWCYVVVFLTCVVILGCAGLRITKYGLREGAA